METKSRAVTVAADRNAGPAIELDDLHLSYTGPGVIRALRGISMVVDRGEIVALVGETGSGKSSLAHSILNLLPSTSKTTGTVRLNLGGKHLHPLTMTRDEARNFRRENVAFIPQLTKQALVPVITIGEHFRQYLSLSGTPSRESSEIAEGLLHDVGLNSPRRVLASYPHQLSGGMAQRVCIALAMYGSSSLVVADEPTSGLDALVKLRVADLLRDTVRAQERTMLLVTHDLLLVQRIATRVAVLYGGCLVETGSVAEVFETPKHPYTRALIGSTPQPGYELKVLSGTAPRLPGELTSCVFADRCPVKSERCLSEMPALQVVSPGHEVASWCIPK